MKFFLLPLLFCLSLLAEEPSDHLQFGKLWQEIKEIQEDALHEMILKRREEISTIKEAWRDQVAKWRCGQDSAFYQQFEKAFENGKLVVSNNGYGAAYFLLDENSLPLFVVKPFDEDILCLNNRKHFASPFNDAHIRVRRAIPLYRSMQAEALAYHIAQEMDLSHITPKTVISILKNEAFYDISDTLNGDEKERFILHAGGADREKLCSIQEYLPHMRELFDLTKVWIDGSYSDKEIEDSINQRDFEDAILLIWMLYDTDAHAGNIQVIPIREGFYGLKKCDNGLTFPEKNRTLFNSLAFLPNARHPPSEELRHKIREIPIERLIVLIEEYGMEKSLSAFLERVEVVQELNEREDLSISEINLRLRALELPSGKKLALSPLPREVLEQQILKELKFH